MELYMLIQNMEDFHFKDVIQPAIDLAEKGFPITKGQAEDLNSNRTDFIERNSVKTCFCKRFIMERRRYSYSD